jgi:thiamine biosynthesis lipoprotein
VSTSVRTGAVPVWRDVVQLMGLPVSVALRGREAGSVAGQNAWDCVVAELRSVDAVFSTYLADSIISRLDRGDLSLTDLDDLDAGVAADVREVLELGAAARDQTAGAFDIRRPHADGTKHLDPSGVVKGWAVQRAARHLGALGDTDFCLSAGGDLVARVVDPARPAWNIGIENPARPCEILATVPLHSGALATSGSAHRGAHIVDARTGLVPERVAQVTVIAEDLAWADIDATAAFALGPEAAYWLAGRPGRTGLVTWTDGSTETICSVPQSLPLLLPLGDLNLT